MRELYPVVEPFAHHSIAVDDGHVLHAAEFGRPNGLPAVVLHGGPGAGSRSWHARLFDPDVYRVVLFDQRGCGRSTPHGSLEANTTWHLLADIERIREHLGIEQWAVLGGSWGATLGVLYAETRPERVRALFLRGLFLGRTQDIDWMYHAGANRLLPDAWREFVAPIAPREHGDLLSAYHRRLFGDDDIARMAAAKAWSTWEGRASTLMPDPEVEAHFASPSVALSLARIECEYYRNRCWLAEDELIDRAGALDGIPGVIVHGRYDLVCPLEQADTLATAWPDAELRVIPDAGHAGLERGTIDALVRATDRFADTGPGQGPA